MAHCMTLPQARYAGMSRASRLLAARRPTCLPAAAAYYVSWSNSAAIAAPAAAGTDMDMDASTSPTPVRRPIDQRTRLTAGRAQTPLSIEQCVKLGQSLSHRSLLKNLIFLNRELPVRFSKRILELDRLPRELKDTHPFISLSNNYTTTFDDLIRFSDNSQLSVDEPEQLYFETEESTQRAVQQEYMTLLQDTANRHKQDVVHMAHGISLFKYYVNQRGGGVVSDEIQEFLNSFNRGRLGIRIMIGHHLALQNQLLNPHSSSASSSSPRRGTGLSAAQQRKVGIIDPLCDIEALVQEATQSAQFVFFQHYNTVFPPQVHIEHAKQPGGRNIRFPVVPALLHHILFELLKNAMRATAEFHGLEMESYPEIEIKLSASEKDGLIIQIKDQGGGFPTGKVIRPFDYMFTTASNTVCLDFPSILNAVQTKPQTSATNENLPLCGFGFGLATSRLYARLFGGDLSISSIPGSGTVATVNLRPLEEQIERSAD
ncbi:hypothetical protein DFQ27_008845 [Actinomortierella ambigua]|uniref:Protein-serine/threonine kinase n=1 Tax=Actinomortierella ambigua TaxID=1343610 RepID=A0A9P6TXD8_9FUNG|nr:hypothetical protein DFQ27_008845 [Actinomortierella ambigua]